VVGRNIDEISEIAEIVRQALALGALLASGLVIGAGVLLSSRARDRLIEVNRRIQRIVAPARAAARCFSSASIRSLLLLRDGFRGRADLLEIGCD
jgi:hypothetical protein